MLAWILIIPAIAVLVTLASRRTAPWVTLAAAVAVLILSASAALEVDRAGLLEAAWAGLSLDALAALYLLLVAFVGVTAALYSIGYLQAQPPNTPAHRRRAIAPTGRFTTCS